MRAKVVFRLLAIIVVLSGCGRNASAPPVSSNAPVIIGQLQVVPAEAVPGQTVWIYLDRIEANGQVNYAWTVNGESVEGQGTSAIQYQVPLNVRDAILVRVSVTAQDYHQELSTLIKISGVETNPDTIPLPPPDPLSCSSSLLSAPIGPYQSRVSGSGTIEYCQAQDGKLGVHVKLLGMPVTGSYVFTLQAADGEADTTLLLAKIFEDPTGTGAYQDFPLDAPTGTGDLQSQFFVELLPGTYAFKFLIKDAGNDYLTVMNNDHPDPITITQSLGFQKGISYVSWRAGEFSDPASDQSLEQLAATGANWIALVVTRYQDNTSSTEIKSDLSGTPTDDDVKDAIAKARELGLHVMLKPHIDLQAKDGTWRGQIGEKFSAADWDAWFNTYREFILHYAHLAEENRDVVGIFCVGTELVTTSSKETEWQQIVQEVREAYKGELVYASNWDGENPIREWWKELDYIGVDAYFPFESVSDSPTVEELKAAWQPHVATLEELHNQVGIPVILTELGYPSSIGAHKTPWKNEEKTVDKDEQAKLYHAALETLMDKSWLVGIYWWNWIANPDPGEAFDHDFTPQRKLAESILTKYYGSLQVPLIAYGDIGRCPSLPPGGAGRALFSTKTKDVFQATVTLRNLIPNHGYLFTLSCKDGDSNCRNQLPTSKECSTDANGYCDITLPTLTDAAGSWDNEIKFELSPGQYNMKFFIKDPSTESCIVLYNDNPGSFTVIK